MSDQCTNKTCKFPGCNRPLFAKGFCNAHRAQEREGRTISPIKFRRPSGSPPVIRYLEVECLVKNLVGPCHQWIGSKCKKWGYGRVGFNNKILLVHRYVWELSNGKIPEGLVVDHQCRNRACCNVNHLKLVSTSVNVLENSLSEAALNTKKTHCPKGHPYDEENTYLDSNGWRYCRLCMKRRSLTRKNKQG